MFWKKKKPESPWNVDFNNYNKQYTEPFGKKENDGENNIILTENIFLSLNFCHVWNNPYLRLLFMRNIF